MDIKNLLKSRTTIFVVVALIVGFVFGMQYKAYQIRSVFTETFSGTPTTTQQISAQEYILQEKAEEEVIIKKEIGEEVNLATINLLVNKIEEKQTLNPKYGSPEVAAKNAKFVVINADFTNVTDAPFTFWTDGMVIKDQKGRNYDPYDDSIGSVDNYIDARDLAPNITENGNMVFEIPQDAESYTMNIGKAGTNEIYSIKLK